MNVLKLTHVCEWQEASPGNTSPAVTEDTVRSVRKGQTGDFRNMFEFYAAH